MGFRSRVGDTLVRVGKTFGASVPESFREGEAASQMDYASPFSPGAPIGPYEGFDRHPRAFNYQTAYNIATRPRTHEAVSFGTLQGLIQSYDVATICIWHRIDSIRSLDWKLLPAEHYNGDVTDAVPIGLAALRKPDRINSFKTWLAKYLYDVLAYDAGTLYRLRNRAGRCVGLSVVDGTTIAPLLDYWGNPPQEPAEAFVQYVNGVPWNWLTRADIIYEPFRPRPNSPYGHAPIESILLNANTDLRFQVYFLQRFSDGNLPAAFASSPESWSPDQIEQFQQYWDSFMYGDQARKHQIRWMPPGSKFEWSNEKDFSDTFSLFLMRKTAAAFHVVPSDIGFTENVNRSSGESQADVQHRVGDLPLMEHVEGIISAFLQDDLGLPLRHEFDRGEEQVDQAAQAEADQRYMDRAVVSASEIREMRYGLTDAKPVARVFFTERAGPIPLNSLEAVAGPVDAQTAAPAEGAELPRQVFEDTPGVQPNPPIYGQPLAEQVYGPSAIPPDATTSRGGDATPAPVAKEGEGAAPGITSETSLYSYDLVRDSGDEDEDGQAVAKEMAAELAAFRRFERSRRKAGIWRDFEFRAVDSVCGHNLNDAGRLAVRKAAGEVAVAGLAVQAADTGRVLMLQRAICDDDPASGDLEFPGGHVEGQESPLQAAWREWSEETGAVPPPGEKTGEWTSSNGIYRGIVWTTGTEASVPVRGGAVVPNPDDPDGDAVEAIMWVAPADLPGNPMLRPELAADLDAVMAALGVSPACCGGECCQDGGCCGGTGGCSCGPKAEAVAKAADLEPPRPGKTWADLYARRAKLLARHEKAVTAAWNACVAELSSPRAMVRQFRAQAVPVAKLAGTDRSRWKDAGTAAALAWLEQVRDTKGYPALIAAIEQAITDGMAEGQAGALALAASRQGVKGFSVAAAFGAAAIALQGNPGAGRKAQDTAAAIVTGTAADIGLALADQSQDDGTEQDMTDAAQAAASGLKSLPSRLKDAIWGAIAAGVAGIISRISGGEAPEGGEGEGGEPEEEPGEEPGRPPRGPDVIPPDQPLLIAWFTDGNPCRICQDIEAGSPYLPQDVPAIPVHPHCQCDTAPYSDFPASLFAAYLLS